MKKSTMIAVTASVMLVAFFLLPLFSPAGSEREMGMLSIVSDVVPTTMIGVLLKGSLGCKLCLLLMLLAPVYMLLQVYQDRLPIPKAVFPLTIGLTALVPLVLVVIFGFYLDGSFMVSGEGENKMDTMRNMVFFTAAMRVSWAYYLYLSAAVVSAWVGISNGNGSQQKTMQKGCAIALAALLLIIVANSQTVLFSMDKHSIFKFNEYGRLSLNGMMMGFGWIFTIVCLYIAVSAFRNVKALEGMRKYLLSVKTMTIVVTLTAVLALVLCIGITLSDKEYMIGSASLSALIIAVGMVVMAFTPTGEQTKASAQEAFATEKKERRPSWLMTHKKQAGIGIGAVALVLLLMMLIPKACSSGPSAIDEDIELVEEDTLLVEEVDELPVDAADSPSFVLDRGVLGPIAIGMAYTDLPQSVEGLYDSFRYKSETHEDEMDGEWTEEYVVFYKDGKEVFTTGVDGKKITSVTLLKNATNVKTADGYYIGYNARKLFQEKKMEWGTYYMGEVFASKDGYTYFVNSDDVNTEIPEKASDFKANAMLSKIVYM